MVGCLVHVTSGVRSKDFAFCSHSVFMCFVWIWEQTAIISLYNINWLVCITETGCVYCAVRTEHLTFSNSTFCPHSVFMCFVWIWEQTAIISLYNINWRFLSALYKVTKERILWRRRSSVHDLVWTIKLSGIHEIRCGNSLQWIVEEAWFFT